MMCILLSGRKLCLRIGKFYKEWFCSLNREGRAEYSYRDNATETSGQHPGVLPSVLPQREQGQAAV